MFGRCATLPVDLEIRPALPEEEVDNFCNMHELNLTHLREERAQRLEEAKANIVAAQVKQKAEYDRKHAKAELFQKGQLILRKDCRRKKKKGGKLDARFLGPYVIQRELQRGTYELRRRMASPQFMPQEHTSSHTTSQLPIPTRVKNLRL